MDVKTTFLNRNLEEDVYRTQHEGFSTKRKEHLMCKLKKSIYGLKQAFQQWHLKFNDTIILFGFKKNIIDQCIYIKAGGSKIIFFILYVDDILLTTNDLGLLHETKEFLFKNFEIFPDRTLGLLKLFQKAYINKVLERFEMKKCSASVVPIQKGHNLSCMKCPKTNWNANKWKKNLLYIYCWKLNICSDMY